MLISPMFAAISRLSVAISDLLMPVARLSAAISLMVLAHGHHCERVS